MYNKDNLKIQLDRIKKKGQIDFRFNLDYTSSLMNELKRIKNHNKENPYYKIPLPNRYHFEKLAKERYDKIRGGNHCLQQFSNLHTTLEENKFKGFMGSTYLNDIKSLKEIDNDTSGVYLLYDIDDILLYVGESNCVRKRVRQHQSKYDIYRVGILFCEKKYKRALEVFVISNQLPLHNSETKCFYN